MFDFFRKVKIVRRLKKLTIKTNKSNAEEETGVPFAITRQTFLGAIAEKDWWGLPNKFIKNYKKDRVAKDINLLRELSPSIVKIETQQERDDEAEKKMGVSMYRSINFVGGRPNHAITVRLGDAGHTYCNPTVVFERFVREFVRITGALFLILVAIWSSNYLLVIKGSIKLWLCTHGLDTMCL